MRSPRIADSASIFGSGRALPVAIATFVAGLALGFFASSTWSRSASATHVSKRAVRQDAAGGSECGASGALAASCRRAAPVLPRPDLIEAEWKAFCASVVEETPASASRGEKGSQFQQDFFLFANFYADVGWGKGVFVDMGANHYSDLSNTIFFEKCLGWRGVCVEPQQKYHEGFRAHRKNCHLMENCVWSEPKSLFFGEGTGAAGSEVAASGGAGRYECVTVDTVMQKAKELYSTDKINLVSLDIEGAEVASLSTYSFGKTPLVDVWIVENFWSSYRDLDFVFTLNGFVKRFQLAIDAIYTPALPFLPAASTAAGASSTCPLPVKPKTFVAAWNMHQAHARKNAGDFSKGNLPSFVLVDQCSIAEGQWA